MSTAFRANGVYCAGVLFLIYYLCVYVFVQVPEEAKEGQAPLAGVTASWSHSTQALGTELRSSERVGTTL